MELRCYIYERGVPMSVDTDLYPYEVISVIDELENLLNPKGLWDETEQKFVSNDTDVYYSVSPKKHMDYLIVGCEHKRTRKPTPFPKEFLDKWVRHGVPFYIHPANYGMPPVRRVWNQVTVRLTLADDRTLRTIEMVSEEPCSI
jgi:hypothetical protein